MFSAAYLQFSETTTSQTHFGFTNTRSEVLFRIIDFDLPAFDFGCQLEYALFHFNKISLIFGSLIL